MTTKLLVQLLFLLAVQPLQVQAVYSATSTDPSQIGSIFCQRPYKGANTMDLFYPQLTIDNPVLDQLALLECDCRVGIINNFYQYADTSTLTTARMGDLSISRNKGLIATIKTSWSTATGALQGISVSTNSKLVRVVGTIGNGASTFTPAHVFYVTAVQVTTFFDASISEIPLICSIYIETNKAASYAQDNCGAKT